jgi:hypothetical protein
MRVFSNKLLQKYDYPMSHDAMTHLSAQNLSDSNFPEAALAMRQLADSMIRGCMLATNSEAKAAR